jgi:HEAT repeat protein
MATALAYCIHCWATIPVQAPVCPACGAPTADAGADIVDKYIAALQHPQAETRLRAAWMLGRMRAVRALPALQEIVRTRGHDDPYLLSAAVQSLGQIGDDRTLLVLRDLLDDQTAAFMARVQAINALNNIINVNERGREVAAAALPRESEGRA